MTTARLSEIADLQLGKMLSPKAKGGLRPIPYLRNANVQWNRFDLTDVAEMDFSAAEEEKFALRDGDVLVCEGGEPGRAAVWRGLIERCCFQKSVHRIRPHNGVLDSEYLVYRLWHGAIRGEFDGDQSATTIAHLPAIRLAQLQINVPPIDAQRRLAHQLAAELEIVRVGRSRGASLRLSVAELRAQTYRQAFGLRSVFAIDRIGDTADGWSWHLLTDLAQLESGHTPSRRRPDWWNGDIPWIALPDIRRVDGEVISSTLESTNDDGVRNSSARVLPPDTVVMSRTASVGFVTRMGRPMATSQDFVNWVCRPDLDPEFLMHLLIRARPEIRALASGAIHKTVYMPTVKSFRVCVPSIAEQRRIVAQLRDQLAEIDRMRAALGEQLEAVDALPAALLRQAFGNVAA